MAELKDAYERIMDLGREEAALIADRDTERLGSVLREREDAISAFVAGEDAGLDSAFMEKLLAIQAMNSRLRNEARTLHQSLKDELLRLRSENRRMSGYRNGAMITPLKRQVLSRRG